MSKYAKCIGLLLVLMSTMLFVYACKEEEIVNITIIFDSNGGSPVASLTTGGQSVITLPQNPTKEGWIFGGWYWDDKTFNDPFTGQSLLNRPVTSGLTVYAKWNEEEAPIGSVKVTFNAMGGTDVTPVFVQPGRTIGAPQVSRVGHTLDGWYLSFSEGETFDERWMFGSNTVNNDIVLYAKWNINRYTIRFDTDGGSSVSSLTQYYDTNISVTIPQKEGHSFVGWSPELPATMPAENMWITAQWQINQYTISFVSNGGTSVGSITQNFGSVVSVPNNPNREGFGFSGWYKDEMLTTLYTFDTMKAEDMTLYARWVPEHFIDVIAMVQVGETNRDYTIPTVTYDWGSATVIGGYLMATTQTTYELWYTVRVWAEAHGYRFQNQGREGSHGTDGATPTTRKLEPVTMVSWRDTVVWLNALSDMKGLDPVYRTSGGAIIKNSRDSNGSVVDKARQTGNNGYRLPTSNEWEMAARWRNTSGDGSILVGGRYWTPGNYASGATASVLNQGATRAVAWYSSNSGSKTQPVGQLLPNHLGIYGMSGNVFEWTYTPIGSNRVGRGGSWNLDFSHTQVGGVYSNNPSYVDRTLGFRFVRNP